MQAFAVIRLQKCLVALLVMPWLVAPTWLHGGENTHHARLFSALLQNLLDPVFLAQAFPAAHELDLDPVFGGDTLHVCAQRLAQRLGPLRVVEDPDLVLVEVFGHPAGIAPPRYRALNNDPVVTGENPSDLVFVPLC